MRVVGAIFGAIVGVLFALVLLSLGVDSIGVLLVLGASIGALTIHRRAPSPVAPAPARAPAPPVSLATAAGPGTSSRSEAETRAFLQRSLGEGLIDQPTYERLSAALRRGSPVSIAAPSVPPPRPTGSVPVGPERPPTVSPTYAPMPARVTRVVEPAAPSPLAAWFARLREAVVSDVAVHGLAYLGVFLLFAGTLGFFLFSFGSLSLAARPWAEFAIPTVLLASAWFLRRRGAPVVATALGIVGGVLLPVVVFASFVDRVQIPPDFSDTALGVAAILTSLALAAVYGASPLVIPDASVRFLAAPLVWTACWSVGLLLPDAPDEPLKVWTAAQFAFVSIGVAATAVAVARWPKARLARDARPSLVPGAIVALGLGLLLAAGEDWPWWVLVVLGLASLVSVEATADRLGDALARILPAPLLWLTSTGLLIGFDEQVAGPALVVGSLALLEWQTWRGRGGPISVGLNGIGAAVGLVLATSVEQSHAWAPVAALAPLVAWSQVRRLRPLEGMEANDQRVPLVALAVGTPFALAVALLGALPDAPAFVGLAFALLVIAGLSRARVTDVVLAWWVEIAAVSLAATAALWTGLTPGIGAGLAAALVGAGTTAAAVPHVPPVLRTWVVAAGLTLTSWFVLEALDVAIPTRWGAAALAGAAATVVPTRSRALLAQHAGLAAWLLSTAAALALGALPDAERWLVVALLAWTMATAVATLAFERWGTGTAALVGRWFEETEIGVAGHIVPVVLTAAGPVLVVLAVDRAWPLIDLDVRVAVGILALLEAALTWLVRERRVVAQTLGMTAVLFAVGAAVAAVDHVDVSTATLGLTVAAVAVLAPVARQSYMPWVAWAASGAFVLQLGRLQGVADHDLPVLGLGWASLLALGGLVTDDLLVGRRAAGAFVRRRSCLPPTVLGLGVFPIVTVLTLTGSDQRIAAFALLGAAVCAAIAGLLRLGSISGGSWALASVAAAVTSPWSPAEEPWVAVPWAAALSVVGLVVRPRDPATTLERRWDLPALGVAGAVLVLALAWAVAIDEVAVTWSAVGVFVLVVAWALRSPWLTTAGRVLVVIGALDAGPGWAALVLAIVAVAVALTAARYDADRASIRLWHQVGAAALAAGALWELDSWAGWTLGTLTGVAMVCAGVAVVAGVVLLLRVPRSPWILQSGSVYVGMQLLGFYAAALAWPVRAPMLAALLTAAGAAAVIGAFWRILPLTMAAPVLAGLAWLVAVQDLLVGTAMWWAAPAGLILLVEAGLVRSDRRERGLAVAVPNVTLLEYAGMASLLAPPLVEIFTIEPARGLIAVGIGLALAGWGVVTKVRRRLFTGVAGVVGAVLLMLVGPIARLIPQIEGPMLWASLALLGLVLVLIATSLERGRARLARVIGRLDEILGSWE